MEELLKKYKSVIKFGLKVCAHCGMCANSCFLYVNHKDDPTYTPAYKFLNSLGYIYKKKGNLSKEDLEKIKELIWKKCVLCTRCYCPIGIDIPKLISVARDILRQKGIDGIYEN